MKTQGKNLSTLLYVEDDEVSQQVVTMFLRDIYNVEIVTDSYEALNKLKSNHYSAVLLDISLQKQMNGLELAKQIRTLAGYEKVSLIAVTAHAFREDEKKILDGGCTHYIAKPFSKAKLIETIERAISGS